MNSKGRAGVDFDPMAAPQAPAGRTDFVARGNCYRAASLQDGPQDATRLGLVWAGQRAGLQA